MKIVIHQSLCGENNKAWDLIKTSMTDIGIAKSIAFKTDLQEHTGGLNWVPAVRGFVEGEYYLIMKTFEDTSLDVRRGRKFSHVLIIQKEELIKINNLQLIFNLLHKKINKEASIESISMEIDLKESIIDFQQPFLGRFNKLIHGFLNVKDYFNTIIWFGQESFDLAVVELWKRLTESERQNLNFGISFNNDITRSENINLITVPESIQSRFLKSDFFLIGKNDIHIPTELSEQILIGDQKARLRIDNFTKAIESKSLSRSDINPVSKGINTFENLDVISDLKKLNTLSHIIAQYSQSEGQGVQIKSHLVNRIAQIINSAEFSEIVVLRSFKYDSFKDSKDIISVALKEWVHKKIFQIKEKSTEYKIFFDTLFINKNSNWWDKTLEIELKLYLGKINSSKASVVYVWLTVDPNILIKINAFLDKSKESELSFLDMLSIKNGVQFINQLKVFSAQNKWYRLYAKILNNEFEFSKALLELLKIDQDENNLDAINIILHGKNPKLIVDFAVENGENRILIKSGELITETPKLLNAINVANINWQIIWLESIKNGNDIETGLKNINNVINELFDVVISENQISEELLVKISESRFANIISYPNRNALWSKIPLNAKNNFLKQTSSILLEQLSKNSTTKIPEDNVLSEYISKTGISDFLYYNRNNIKSVIPLFEKFTQLSDYNLRDYLNNYSGPINSLEAKQLGKVINNRNFYNAASIIHSKADKNNNWKFALSECHFILGFFQKAAISISGILSSVNIPTDQWWQSAEEIIVELYPNATSIVTVWKKAGGKESELIMSNTAANAWNDALFKLRRNNFKDITMNDLLKVIKKQYDNNSKFKIIFDLRKTYIKTN